MQVKGGYKQTEIGLIPKDWSLEKLVNLADAKIANSFIDGDWIEAPHITDEGVHLIQTGNVGNGRYLKKNLKFISQSSFDELRCKLVNQGDILICRLAEPAGRSCFAPEGFSKMITAVDVTIFRPAISYLAKEFFVQYANSSYFLSRVDAVSGGSTRKRVNRTNLGKLAIPVPPIKEQQKIAEILSTVDSKLGAIDVEIEQTRTLKKGLMQTLLTQGIGHTQFKDSPLGNIPENWDVMSLGEVSNGKGRYGIGASAVEYNPAFYTYLRITDIDEDGRFISSSKKSVSAEGAKYYLLKSGDIVFARTGNTTGKTYLYKENDGELVFAGFLICFSPNQSEINPRFLKAVTETKRYWKWVRLSSTRTGQPGINSEEYSKLLLQIPPLEEQTKIANILSTVDDKIELLQQRKAKTETLKKGLMQKLLMGEVRVKVA